MTVDSLLRIVKAEPNIATARTKMQGHVAEQEREASADYKNATKRLGDPYRLIDGFLDPKFIYRLHHDPKRPITKIRIPVLVLYGDKDSSVDVIHGIEGFKHLLDATRYEIELFSGLNHLFMKTDDLSPDQYHTVEETIAPDVLHKIYNWIHQL